MTPNTQLAERIQDTVQRMSATERMKLWTSLLERSKEGIVVCDPQQRILLVNSAFERITGYSAEEAVGQTPRMLHSGRQKQTFYANMWRCLQESGRWSGQIWNRRRNGESYVQWLTVQAVCNGHGDITHYLGIFSDITRDRAARARMRRLSERDPLTRLPNRGLLIQRLRQAIESAHGSGENLAILCIDLDRFNDINDSMGHEAGDLLLQTVAHRIRSAVRHSDLVARTSADEFVVLLPGLIDANAVTAIAHKVLEAIRKPTVIKGQELVMSASAGICVCPGDGNDPETVLRNAVAAMQSAKQEGRGDCRTYAREINERAPQRLRLENALRLALERKELMLHYQPQVDLASGAIVGAEALVRWNRPGVGMVPPGEFIPLAEETGLIFEMGRWAITEAIRQVQVWSTSGLPPITVSVNISAGEFRQPGFVEHLAQEIRAHGIDPARLELELTESIAVDDVEATIRTLNRLHDLGVRLALDDFGTGYCSLGYLGRFRIDKIKIDRSFISEMHDKPEALQIVRAILALAGSLRMKVIAEGVETHEQLNTLRQEGCGEIQGYLASSALPAEQFCRFAQEWKPWTPL